MNAGGAPENFSPLISVPLFAWVGGYGQAMMDLNTGMPFETVNVTTLGRSRAVFESLLAEAAKEAAEADRKHTVVYKSWGSEWHPFGKPRLRRPLGSVILDEGVAEGIVKDFTTFAGSRQW